MALYLDEEEVWKCPKHPSKRRRSGICPICLRDRLITLCPDCANVRPCSCCPTTSSSSSSASSSFHRFSLTGDSSTVGNVGRVYTLIDREPSLRRSRSMAIPFLRSRSRFSGADSDLDGAGDSPAMNGSRSARSFWSLFRSHKNHKEHENEAKAALAVGDCDGGIDASRKTMMQRSRSVAVAVAPGGERELRARSKGKAWFFPSPMKAFRQTKVSKVVQERSPLYRG
ncbi:hypothetical protein PIB30_057965 [Stylosanthes scabra]|uniref:Uncharacterized protein n=1 Tax=Stylosanthes scabra TaxID=79078 RepID=A0ABU6QKG2_9FABA|nr:hypothetical protein [Stylosanthes scabra]